MIELQDLRRCYGSKQAVQQLSLTIQKGEIVGLLGLNGAGKSTTMNLLAGCLSPTAGNIYIDGIDLAKEPLLAKRKIGYLPEIPPLYPDMRVQQYLEFIYDLKGVRGDKKRHLSEVCAKTGVEHVKKRLIQNLSKGYRQRVGLAQALIGDPPVLVLDEPTVGLDPTQIIEMRTLIGKMSKEHTILLSSHILSEIQAVCSRVVVLHSGQIVADDTPERLERALQSKTCCVVAVEGDPQEVLAVLEAVPGVVSVRPLAQTEPDVTEYEITGAEQSDVRRPVFRALAAADLPLLGMRSANLTLEDVFLQLVGAKHAPQPPTGGEA